MSDMDLAARLRSLWGTRTERLLTLARLGGLAAVIWAVASQLEKRIPGEHWAVPVLAVAAVIGWIGWMASRRLEAPDQLTGGFLALLGAAGGVLVAFAPDAIWFVAVAALGSAIAFEAGPAVAVGAAGLAHWWWPS